jgi:pantoate--beta-alanine ligase
MILFKKAHEIHQHISELKKKGLQVGWVPTMGALHQGHLSLIKAARQDCQQVVCSIFVNPTQFNNKTDFIKYPITIEKDIQMLTESGADLLFLPTVDEIYPKGVENLEHYDLGKLEKVFEGEFRPGHFQGVCQVMSRFIKIIDAQHLYMGRKDYQQCMVIARLLEIMKQPMQLHKCPTERDPDGLAMSSRNMRLNNTERKDAVGIFEALTYIKQNLKTGSLHSLLEKAKSILLQKNFRVDYIATADATTLDPIQDWDGKESLVALVAAYQNEVRLIDNDLVTPSAD